MFVVVVPRFQSHQQVSKLRIDSMIASRAHPESDQSSRCQGNGAYATADDKSATFLAIRSRFTPHGNQQNTINALYPSGLSAAKMAAGKATKSELQSFLAGLQRCMANAAAFNATPDNASQGEGGQARKTGRTGFVGVTKHK